MGYYDWLDLTIKENQIYLLGEAEYWHEEAKKIPPLEETVSNQKTYIRYLEKQLRLLQKTLDVIEKIRRVRRVKARGR